MLNSCLTLQQIKFSFHNGKTHRVHINQAVYGSDFSEGWFCVCLSQCFQIQCLCSFFFFFGGGSEGKNASLAERRWLSIFSYMLMLKVPWFQCARENLMVLMRVGEHLGVGGWGICSPQNILWGTGSACWWERIYDLMNSNWVVILECHPQAPASSAPWVPSEWVITPRLSTSQWQSGEKGQRCMRHIHLAGTHP